MKPQQVDDIYELSPTQQGLLFHSVGESGDQVYFIQYCGTIEGDLNPSAFEQAWRYLVQRHPIFRTSFHWEEMDKPLQVVHKKVVLPFEYHDWSSLPELVAQQRLDEYLEQDRRRGMRLTKAPLMRVAVFRTSDRACRLLWTFHHLLIDGWCLSVVFPELFEAYEAFATGGQPALPAAPPYGRYIEWLGRQNLAEAETFWRRTLAGFDSPVPLPLRSDPAKTPLRAKQTAELPAHLLASLKTFARQQQLTLNTLVQAAWAVVLSRFSGRSDIVFGAVVAGRPVGLEGAESIIGPFINTLPLRVQVEPQQELLPWLKAVQDAHAETRVYDYSPLAQVQEWSEISPGTPLIEIALAFENYPAEVAVAKNASSLKLVNSDSHEQVHFPLGLVITPAQSLVLQLHFNGALFTEATITGFLDLMLAVLEKFATRTPRTIVEVSALGGVEQQRLVSEWNSTSTAYPGSYCVHNIVELQAGVRPDAPAVSYGATRLSYAELDRLANHLAHRLRQFGIGPETVVALYLERSPELSIAMLAVMKAGGCYLPLDVSYPRERIEFMLADSHASVIITHEALPAVTLAGTEIQRLFVSKETCDAAPAVEVNPENTACVLYTSGSTGQPKGICLPHRALIRLACSNVYVDFNQHDVVAQVSNCSFDAASMEIWGALLNGGHLVGVDKEIVLSPVDLARQIEACGITVMVLPTGVFHNVAAEAPAAFGPLRALVVGGDRMDPDACRRILRNRPPQRLINGYGPAENSTITTWELVGPLRDDVTTLPIGRPVSNTQVYVLDRFGDLLPVGVTGELYVGGAGLASRYLNRPSLTAERFIPDLFSGRSGARLYRTGDLARWLPDGRLEFQGRADHQVKIRGYRIEPGEVEAVLNSHTTVAAAAVLVLESEPGNKQLVACVGTKPEDKLAESQIRNFLDQRLPEYMVPARFLLLEKLPLTPNGKVDRAALSALVGGGVKSSAARVAPRDEFEGILAGIWEEVLKVRPIGIKDNFFQVGGHSLLAMRVVALARKRLHLNVPISLLLETRTVERLADALRWRDLQYDRPALAPLQPAGTSQPLFCIHPGSGNALCYVPLATGLGEDQPVYGIQDPWIRNNPQDNKPGDFNVPLAKMAAAYVREIRQVQPTGPYTLLGWSFGCHVAFEMAQQLISAGQTVSAVMLLDGASPDVSRVIGGARDDAELMSIIAREMGVGVPSDELRTLPAEQQLQRVAAALHHAGLVDGNDALSWTRRELDIFKSRIRVVCDYYPARLPTPLVLFRASEIAAEDVELFARFADDPTLGWSQLSDQPVDVHYVPGDHAGICREPHVGELARLLSHYLMSFQPDSHASVAR
jgi:surfactin family lipopeptide synthetase C